MTILPVKKKREKESGSRSTSTVSSSSDPIRQAASSNANTSSAPKRRQQDEAGPSNKRSPDLLPPILSSAAPLVSPRGSNQNQPSTSSDHSRDSRSPTRRNNSDDEYDEREVRDDSFQLENEFSETLARRGLIIKEMVGDGACMFRAIAEQIYGDQEMHGQIRQLCMDYMANNQDHFRAFITEDYDAYIQRKREQNVHGNHVELQAISEMFARPVEVYQYSDTPINVLLPREDPTGNHPADGSQPPNPPIQQNPPLRLSYHRAVHYNAILAPDVPTIGVGLGLPGMVPGSADKDLLSKTMAKSELEHIEETMLQDKIGLTDYQRTQADIEDQISRESLISYLNDLEKAKGQGPSTSEPSTSSAGASESSSEPARTGGLYEEMLAAQSLEWDAYTDDVAIAEALLLSQQDYLSNQNKPGPSGSHEGPSSSG